MIAAQYIVPNLLISPEFSSFTKSNMLSDGVLSVYLNTSAGNVAIGGGDYGAQTIKAMEMDTSFQDFIKNTFAQLSRVVNIDFQLSSDPMNSDMNFYMDTTIDVGGSGTTLGIALENKQPGHNWWEVILNTPALGSNKSYLQYASIHELGHVLGLEHPFDGSDGEVYKSTDPNLSAYPEDTVMAYRNPQSPQWPDWYSVNDIQALVTLWGARQQIYTSANDTIASQYYNEKIDGSAGVDTFVVHGKSTEYSLTFQGGSSFLTDRTTGRDGMDTLTNVERIQFTDGIVAADLAVTAGNAQIYRLYQAAFARIPDEGGLRYWVSQHDDGQSLDSISHAFLNAPEFTQRYGSNLTNAQYVDQLYLNVLGRKGEVDGVTYWNDVLNTGKATKDTVLIGFAESPENVAGTAAHVYHGFFIG